MYSNFPWTENIPKHRRFFCFSVKIGCILTGLVGIIYTSLALFQGSALLATLNVVLNTDYKAVLVFEFVSCIIVIHIVSLGLNLIMLYGAIEGTSELIVPWLWCNTLQLMAAVLMFVFWNTMNLINQFADTSLKFCAIEFFAIFIRWYMLILVSSLYNQIEDEKMETERLRNLDHDENWYNEAYIATENLCPSCGHSNETLLN